MISGGKILQLIGDRNKDKDGATVEGINFSINVDDMRFEKDRVVIRYAHTTTYSPDLATIKVVGELYVQNEPKVKEIEEQWKKTKQLPPAFAEEVLNAINYSASTVGTLMAFGLNIRAPLSLPAARLAPASGQLGQQRPGAKAG